MKRFDIAISFAGEDRGVARRIAGGLTRRKFSVFFDEFLLPELLGRSLTEYLERIFSSEARYCVMLVSEHYVAKPYPRHEKTAALTRALTDAGYIIPLRIDSSVIPGLSGDTCFIDLRRTSLRKALALISQKVRGTKEPAVDTLPPEFFDLFPAPETTAALAAKLEPVLRELLEIWEPRIERLQQKYPRIDRDQLIQRLMSQEMRKVVETVLAGDRASLGLLARRTKPSVSLGTLLARFDRDFVEVLVDLDVIEITGDCARIGKNGRETAARIIQLTEQITFAHFGLPPEIWALACRG